jgi:tRNA 2-thiouridine synthesizing protein A
MSIAPKKTLDAKGLACPMPVLKSKKILKELQIGEVLEILATDPGAMKDIPAWCRTTGQELLLSEEKPDRTYRFLVKRVN